MIGQTISHYRVLSELGHGGMGVVYEAEDVRLGRRVALKLLPEALAHDPTAFQRLKREARAACRLNHPNICTIHEIEEQDGRPVIVMELLEGESLKDRLARGPIPLSALLALGVQIADALRAAHELGIIHRDIKPANIFLTQHESTKILDFGLAKLVAKSQPGAHDATVIDAMDESLTAVGVIPGTATYMSPEQAKGEPLDARTDIFSLGVVLYQMATGEQPFRRKNAVLTLEAILTYQPKPPSRINPALPAELDTIIAKALNKDCEQRYQTAAELRDALWRLKSGVPMASTFSHGEFASGRAAAGVQPVSAGIPGTSAPPRPESQHLYREEKQFYVLLTIFGGLFGIGPFIIFEGTGAWTFIVGCILTLFGLGGLLMLMSDRLRIKEPMGGVATPQAAVAKHSRSKWRKLFLAIASAVFMSVIVTGLFYYSLRRPTRLTSKDNIVLADFDNKTGDPVFDDTLKQALAVDLGQSPFLNIVSDRKMAATLRLMGRSPDQPVTGEIARELCQRVDAKAMLAGSISNLGNDYVIGLNAINCATGDALVKQQVEAAGKEHVLKALGNAATEMRGKLGESLVSVQKFDTPIEQATTPSLEALKAYSMGERAAWSSGDVAGVPYYQRALELDPNFAQAYRRLSTAYYNLGQSTRAIENAKKAFELRERVSEREKYDITGRYYTLVSGEWEKAIQTYELYAQTYPRDWRPLINLGDAYMMLGDYKKALPPTETCVRLEPNTAIGQSNLAAVQLALNHPEDARATVEQARAHSIDSLYLRLMFYQTAFLRGDRETMEQQLTWAAGRSGEEDWLLSTQSDTEAYFGRLGKARGFSQRAVASAQAAGAKETAALWQASAALREAEFGNTASARQNATAALALASGREVKSVVALALARAGDAARAQELADSLDKDFPKDTVVRGYWLPTISSAIAIDGKNPTIAVQFLQASARYELRQCEPFQLGMLYPIYLRGQAYLLVQQGKEAATEFQKIIDHRGIALNFPLGALARLGVARAYALQGNTAKASAAYQDFLTLWKDADPDIPIYKQAKAEYATLQ